MSFVYPFRFDVIVVGGGHAGIEAALAASRMGCSTLLLTMNCDTIGQMSCNPAIGGIGKGHLVREIDALGGEMGKTTDMTGIQFRMLNTKNGPSVRAPRAQCDKRAYQSRMKWSCEREANLTIQQAQSSGLLHKNRCAYGVKSTLGVEYHSTCVVITGGTFLKGLMHTGASQHQGGRSGEPSSLGLSASLNEIGLSLGRFKTGTPPRLLRKSIDFSKLTAQLGDEPPPPFSFWHDLMFHVEHEDKRILGHPYWCVKNASSQHQPDSRPRQDANPYIPGSILAQINCQLPCFLTRTSTRTAELIRSNLRLCPTYSGAIQGIGPRYCPSIEDKIVRFADKKDHQLFLEPEGINTDEIYVNGISTSLPFQVQLDLIRTIHGCESAQILRPAYAVEYDIVFPTQIHHTLETKCCQNLFLAGQINGTSGYEEAAAQGIIAGINAALRSQQKAPFQLRRDQAYIGVMIDDLVTNGTSEPYRMFTSRAERRILLRQDNAHLRLSEYGFNIGLLSPSCWSDVVAKKKLINEELQRLNTTKLENLTYAQILKRPEVKYLSLPTPNPRLPDDVVTQVELMVKYEGYIKREEAESTRLKLLENSEIPLWMDYNGIIGLRTEARQKLSKILPRTIGQAGRIPGITPADIGVILVSMKRRTQ